ncbi:uncharacterized protein LOC117646978 isoform X2 [Thrips palmi]|uniref:Uncharacterized protein LOC117646978 isoform X2 n=1 Tax=Thrips palmi TaxID=161013 RepID=A0A6P8Z3M3_THRPL|nr:uncharacterized protein LOC117646978 isoform X2 [Thrips palmi]
MLNFVQKLCTGSITSIDALSDLSLELVFSFLDTSDLVQASQVCSRWRDLCSSRRLWSSRTFEHHDSAQKEFLGVVRLLRRTHGVVPYTKVTLSIGYTWPPVSISFEDNAETLKIGTSSSLMHLLCLRNLVKDNVKVLRVIENADLLTVAEALVVWEAIASKTSLTALHITMCRNSILHGVTFDWPKRGSLHEFSFSVFNDARFGGRLCRPIRSLLSVHRHQLTRVDISPQDQQGLLNFVPRHLYTLSAVVLPSLIRVLKSAWGLRHLFLDSQYDNLNKSLEVLKQLLSLRLIRSLYQLDVTFKSGCSTAESLALLSLVGRLESLQWLQLRGVCCALSDPECGPTALKDLLTLRHVKTLSVDVEPSTFPLHALLPRTTGGVNSEPLVRLPATLKLLSLGDPAAVSERPCDSKWVQQLRSVMDDYQPLHVRVHGSCLEVQGSGGAAGKVRVKNALIVPHSADHYCEECRVGPATWLDYRRIYIREL